MTTIINLAYLLAASLFILGIKKLNSPATARSGNQLAAIGMLVAVVATLFVQKILSPVEMIGGLALGGLIGVILARRVEMTKMPELVATFNGFGGAASALVAAAEVAKEYGIIESGIGTSSLLPMPVMIIGISIMIGAITFSGSMVAFGKLGEYISGNPITFPGIRVLTVLLAIGVIGCTAMAMMNSGANLDQATMTYAFVALAAISLLLGILLTIPIGGADMPVVVALLNSYSGLAAAATGFVLSNYALIVSGALVGASGLILTKIMCDGMNRSLLNVLLGGFGGDADDADGAAPVAAAMDGRTATEISKEDTAILLSYAESVIIVPGYGMAVAQAQHAVRELTDLLQERGVTVGFAIHPVAGRMPGHMNVLLAEANVSYDLLHDMDDINAEFESTDVALVIGANDVVNPAARTDKASPIYGMPILNVDHAKNVIVMKRSLRPGYAGVQNELFFHNRTSMLFGDAKDSISGLVSEIKEMD